VTPSGWVLLALSAFFAGWLWGRASEAWEWRMSADSEYHTHKNHGRWFRVMPADWRPEYLCPVCWRATDKAREAGVAAEGGGDA
jgi:hypothetical protein